MKSYNYYIPARNQTTHSNNQSLQNVNKEKNYRDIYYLIFDQYSRNDMLKKYYNHNNDYFTDYLVNKGFYVADNSYANYPHTVQSITSSLNMKYLNYLSNNDVSKNNDPYIYYNLIENNQVIKFLKTHNYKYTHFGSEAAATHSNDNADVNYTIYSFSNNLGTLLSIIYKQSIISPVIIRLLKKDIIQDKLVKSVRQLKYEANLYKLNKLADIADDPYPKFVFMHLLIPHAPFVFDQDGTYVTLIEEKSKSRQANYINQVKFLNK
ncbi:MAG: hypothetical protein GWN11_03840 [Candidatus Dadabacteria bacterium]|nr:hypothetical protein [Candidatus Dadabacteria bacterium]NIX15015.1 hypothetical protein [Candidatus Dadabacteria bacterium]